MAQASAVAVNELLYHIIVGHLHDRGYTTQAVYIFLSAVCRIDILHVTVVWLIKIGLGHIEVQQTVQIIGHGFRELDNLFMTFTVDNGYLVFFWCLVVTVVIDLCPRGGRHQ